MVDSSGCYDVPILNIIDHSQLKKHRSRALGPGGEGRAKHVNYRGTGHGDRTSV